MTGMAMTSRDNAEGYIAAEFSTMTKESEGTVAGRTEVSGDTGKEEERVTSLSGIGAATPKNHKKCFSRAAPSPREGGRGAGGSGGSEVVPPPQNVRPLQRLHSDPPPHRDILIPGGNVGHRDSGIPPPTS